MSFATYERLDPAVGVVTLNRPERLNAISGDLLAAFSAALREAEADGSTSVTILRGAGRAFCSGDDLKEFDKQSTSAESIRAHIDAIQEITHLLMRSEKPVIGALHGFAAGGGFEWLLNCDLVVAADDLVAFFPEMEWGQFVTGGVTHLLRQTVGHQRAMELLLLGNRQAAGELLALGLVNRVVPGDQVLDTALALARQIASKSRFSVSQLKQLMNVELNAPMWQAVEAETRITVQAFANPEAPERLKAFFDRKKK
ncbi:MAG TPA: enoyl-CoA hydratase/isomerase family protein [Paracoccus solventivorans]|uniref:Enoyl-CoA hydratase/isomerase family protein n=1 Tax=Paracoccus solventivorans TaxID=53463 RepID=A0A832PN08_9RHOB|nr:enoyl-CoA hydratase/isomerase family protein [Paracoccus solventivorans]HHW33995.1 enoyl-CoA hydratase/isomerase family protein [Paracoccus solventivorans]